MLKKVLFLLMFLPILSFADTSLGEKLVRRLWKDMQEKNIQRIKEHTSKEFQARNFDVTFNRFEELQAIQARNIQTFTLSEIRATEGDNFIVVTYFADVTIIQDDEELVSSSPYVSTWKKFENGWKWVAHADFAEFIVP